LGYVLSMNNETERRTYTYSEIRALAQKHDLGLVTFRQKIAENTGNIIEVAYVGDRKLFAKATKGSDWGYYLCNEFETLEVAQ
jgi:hypothetical protein